MILRICCRIWQRARRGMMGGWRLVCKMGGGVSMKGVLRVQALLGGMSRRDACNMDRMR